MKHFTLSYHWAFLVILLGLSSGSSAAESHDTAQFMKSIAGDYSVEMAGGELPHNDANRLGNISVEGGEAAFTFPYCGNQGVCDPGYLIFTLAETSVTEDHLENGQVVYTILSKNGTTVDKFTWETIDSKVHFNNYQYELPDGQLVTLEHVLSKAKLSP